MKRVLRLRSLHRWVLPAAACLGLFSSVAAIAASYPDTILADQPVAYYRLEDPVFSTAITDSSASGMYVGQAYYDSLGAYPKFQQPGIGSNSVSFHLYTDSGVKQNSHIEIPYTPDLNQPGPFTIECWVRPASWGSDYRCPVGNFGGWASSPVQGWHFYQTPGVGATSTWIWVQKGGNIWLGSTAVTKNKWDYLAAVYDGTNVTFYVNSVADGTFKDTEPAFNTGQPLTIGGNPAGGWYFDGNVDEVAYYTNALSVEQLQTHFAVGLTNFYNGPVPASVVADPVDTTNYAGRTATFGVTADGTAPLSYQWFKGNTLIAGATADTLQFTCAYSDNGASYHVVVTNLYGSATSAPAALTIATDLIVLSTPESVTRNAGSKAAFIALADGALPFTYQWYKGDNAITGETNQTLWLSNVQLTDDNTTYSVTVKNPWNSSNTPPATLTVVARPNPVPITGYAKIVMADDPVAFWRLNEPAGSGVAVDAAGSFDGTYDPGNGTVALGATTGIPRETDTGVSVVDGARVAIPWALELNPHGPFTAEAWFKPATLRTNSLDYRTVFSSMGPGGSSGPNGWLLYQQPDNSFAWVLFNQNWVSSFMGDPVDVVEANTWYHMALTYDGSLFSIYVNGHLSATQTYDAFVPNPDGDTNLGYRSDDGWNPFDGTLDDVAFYNKALTLEQVQTHYFGTVRLNASQTGNSLVLAWPFGTLQQADQLNGTFTDISTATSPYTNAISGSMKFFRVKVY
ncbi:MAG TPA: LamG-like jellyroll fold domain-containing protein [Verrucomicrobiae bacterium]|nr:LamG-like jellyroll fold domain-containing protein [Verrucomicrobiae bacterium]